MTESSSSPVWIAWTIWAGSLGGLATLLLLTHFFPDGLTPNPSTSVPILELRTMGYMLSIILLPIIGGIHQGFGKSHATDPSVSASDTETPAPAPSNLRFFLALTLAESIGIYGMVLLQMGDTLQTFYIFLLVSAIAISLHRPSLKIPA